MSTILRPSAAFLAAFVGFSSACAALTRYDPTSYKTATDLKAQALLLIEKATEAPAAHQREIDDLRVRVRQALEYEKGKGKPNQLTVKQWELLSNPSGHLLGGFLRKWEAEGRSQNPAFIAGASKNVSEAFDEIIKLESGKVKN